MKNTRAFALSAVVGLLLASCTQGNVQTKTPADLFDPGTSVEAQTKINSLLAGIPESEKAGIDRFDIVYVEDDGKVYSNRVGMGVRSGQVIERADSRIVRFSDGEEIPAPIKDGFNPSAMAAKSSTYGTCNTTDGPYWRSYTKSGYAAIRGNLNIQSVSALGAPSSFANQRSFAAYTYFGGQALNGTSTAEGGLVFYSSNLYSGIRIFLTAPEMTQTALRYQEFAVNGAPLLLNTGTSYPTRFQVFADGTNGSTNNLLVWVDVTTNGITTAKIIRAAATKMNLAGTDQYMKRMATMAHATLSGYNGSQKYAAKSSVLMDTVQTGSWTGTGYTWTPWTASSAFSINSDCKWPTNAIVTTAPANTSSTATVTALIDMSK